MLRYEVIASRIPFVYPPGGGGGCLSPLAHHSDRKCDVALMFISDSKQGLRSRSDWYTAVDAKSVLKIGYQIVAMFPANTQRRSLLQISRPLLLFSLAGVSTEGNRRAEGYGLSHLKLHTHFRGQRKRATTGAEPFAFQG